MLDRSEQARRLQQIAKAAKVHDCLVAPVGSVYFLFRGVGRQFSKDIDAVVHDNELKPVDLAVLRKIAESLGAASVNVDEAVVNIKTDPSSERADVELIRGRSRAKGGFFPRALLAEAAKRAERDGNVLFYPMEFVLVLKADAAVDREERAGRDSRRREEHLLRGAAFQADVFNEVKEAMLGKGLNGQVLRLATSFLKKAREVRVLDLLRAAGAPVG